MPPLQQSNFHFILSYFIYFYLFIIFYHYFIYFISFHLILFYLVSFHFMLFLSLFYSIWFNLIQFFFLFFHLFHLSHLSHLFFFYLILCTFISFHFDSFLFHSILSVDFLVPIMAVYPALIFLFLLLIVYNLIMIIVWITKVPDLQGTHWQKCEAPPLPTWLLWNYVMRIKIRRHEWF